MSLLGTLQFLLIPALTFIVSAVIGLRVKFPKKIKSILQHFAGGVVLSATACELIPGIKVKEAPVWAVSLGFFLGVAMLLAMRKSFGESDDDDDSDDDRVGSSYNIMVADGKGSIPWSTVIPTLIDLLCDGLIIGLSFRLSGEQAGVIMAISIALEMAALGAGAIVSLKKSGVVGMNSVGVAVGLSVALALSGMVSFQFAEAVKGTPWEYAALAFGIAAALWLACEDLLNDTHEGQGDEKWYITAQFFIGFLVPILLDRMSKSEW